MKLIFKFFLIAMTITLALISSVKAQKTIVIGHFGDPAPYKVVVINGSLEKSTGWKIEWRKFNSGAEVNAAMASGGIEMSEIGSVPLAAGASSGLDYQLISIGKSIISSESLIVRNGSNIKKLADLKGKKIAVPIGSTAHFSLMGGLNISNISAKEVNIIGMSPSEIFAAWSQHAIDAAFIWNPVQTQLLEDGKLLITAGEIGEAGFPTFNGWVANKKFAKNNRAGIIAFIKTMNEINKNYTQNKQDWDVDSSNIAAVALSVGSTPQNAKLALDGALYLDADAQITRQWMGGGVVDTLGATAEFLKSAGRISTTQRSYAEFVNADFAQSAAKNP